MPQTETVIRQALKERVKPMLFINKVDRMIVEQQVTPEMMIEKFSKIVAEFNQKIMNISGVVRPLRSSDFDANDASAPRRNA